MSADLEIGEMRLSNKATDEMAPLDKSSLSNQTVEGLLVLSSDSFSPRTIVHNNIGVLKFCNGEPKATLEQSDKELLHSLQVHRRDILK